MFKIPHLTTNTFSLREKFRFVEILTFIFVEIFFLNAIVNLLLKFNANASAALLTPIVTATTIATLFIVEKYRELEVGPNALKIYHWDRLKVEISKNDLASIEINFGLNLRPSLFSIRPHHYTHYVSIKFFLQNGEVIEKYKLNNSNVPTFKHLLGELGYPAITETGRGKVTVHKTSELQT
jgi:hypothetical protein